MRDGWKSITNTMDMNLEQTLGDSEGEGSWRGYSPWTGKESDMTVTEQQQQITYY